MSIEYCWQNRLTTFQWNASYFLVRHRCIVKRPVDPQWYAKWHLAHIVAIEIQVCQWCCCHIDCNIPNLRCKTPTVRAWDYFEFHAISLRWKMDKIVWNFSDAQIFNNDFFYLIESDFSRSDRGTWWNFPFKRSPTFGKILHDMSNSSSANMHILLIWYSSSASESQI